MQKNTNVRFEQIMKSFLGFLVGTKKAVLTVSSYRGDLLVLQDFLREKKLNFASLTAKDLDAYLYYLKKRGMSANTQRRKLLTAKSLFRYATKRKKISSSPAQFIKTPLRKEALPWIPTRGEVRQLLAALPKQDRLSHRNRVIVQVLAETGLAISELCALRWDQWEDRVLSVEGKRKRELRISVELAQALSEWRKEAKGDFLFPGFNRHGFFTPRMTPRGVELSLVATAKKIKMPKLKPKSLRHFVILCWLEEGLAPLEIQRRLGVRKAYSLEPYREYLAKLNG